MTHLAVSIAVEDAADIGHALESAAGAARDGATLVEWRIDSLAEDADAARHVARLLADSPLPSIITCRPVWEGGMYEGDDAERISLLEAIGVGPHAPRYFDLEVATFRRSANLAQKVRLIVDHATQPRDIAASLMLSSHDFEGRPADLLRRVSAMADEHACAVVKVAWRARSLRDNLEAFELLRHRLKPMIALCMGEYGLMSRVLARKFGALLTFASSDTAAPTAPGQTTVREMRTRWRFDRITPKTKVYGVIGWPVEQSRSPLLHNSAFDELGHDGVYLPLPIPPEWEHFKATVGALLDAQWLDFRGASVTLPHKAHLVRLVRERGGRIDPAAEIIGAANTLIVDDDGALSCTNTDAPASYQTLIDEAGLDAAVLSQSRVAILGAGGAARAVAWGLAERGATVVIFNRTTDHAERLAADLAGRPTQSGAPARVLVGRPDAISCACFPVVVNCTPVGMTGGPAPDESPLPDDFPFEPGVTIFDTIYAPALTPLLRDARSRGANAVGGAGMFLRQAALQCEAWTGRKAPIAKWRELLAESAGG